MVGKMGIITGLFFTTDAYACTISGRISNVEMVRNAEVIVLVTAEDYAVAPGNPASWSGMVPISKIRFKVVESIRGKLTTNYLIVPGILVDKDDFNDHPSPYTLVRPEGRRGNCFAISYRTGGRFLLMLKKNQQGELTVYWDPLGPVNEQLHSMDDPWLSWVRKQSRERDEKPTRERANSF